MVLPGNTRDVVIQKCGTPQHVDQGCVPGNRGLVYCWDIWTYRPDPSYFPCYMSFRSGILWNIYIGSRFD